VVDWNATNNREMVAALGHILRRHVRTRRINIPPLNNPRFIELFNKSLESLKELKWCTHFNCTFLYGIDFSSISGMTSLQHLNIESQVSDGSSLPLECLPNLTSVAIVNLADLAKIQNPLLLHHLDISVMETWDKEGIVEPSDIHSQFVQLLRFKSLRTLRIGDHSINRLQMRALMSSLTQLQQLSIYSIELSEEDLKESPSAWFGSIPLSLIEIRCSQSTVDLTPLLAFPSLTKLELDRPNLKGLVEVTRKLISLVLSGPMLDHVVTSIGYNCPRLTSLMICGGTNFSNLDKLKSLPLKRLALHYVRFGGNFLSFVYVYTFTCQMIRK
jgi:hypothetical protein